MFEEGLWREALSSVQIQFNIEQLFPEQQESIRAFMGRATFLLTCQQDMENPLFSSVSQLLQMFSIPNLVDQV